MKLALPKPSGAYDPGNEAQARAALEEADLQNIKRTDLAIARLSGRGGIVFTSLQFRDTVTGAVKTLSIQSGAVVVT
jgi:hypothetical protein